MHPIVYHIASGQSLFTGCLAIVAAVSLSWSSGQWPNRLRIMLAMLGLILIVVSSAAIPFWVDTIGLVLFTAFVFFCSGRPRPIKATIRTRHGNEAQRGSTVHATRFNPASSAATRNAIRWLLLIVVAIAMACEVPYHFQPKLQLAQDRSLTVIADSITAGMGSGDPMLRWPQRIEDDHRLDVQDLARPGETVESAASRNQGIVIRGSVVVLEIGGNDLLGSTTLAEFEEGLDRLLSLVADGQRQVVMFELPLLPLQHRFGRAQRRLARKHHVHLLPKRLLLDAIQDPSSTMDSIHLTESGHARMAKIVWTVIAPAFDP